jgi:hypothetical protein
MKFPIAHDFQINGVYVCKVDPNAAWGSVKQADGSFKPHKKSLFSKLFEVATTESLRVPYKIIVVRERITYDLDGRIILSWSDAHLEVSQLTVTGELYGIINSFKDKNKYSKPWAFRIELAEERGSDSIWQSVEKDKMRRLYLKYEGNKIVYSSADMENKPYSDEYNFMQWES